MRKIIIALCWIAASTAYAQEWEVGALGGWGYSPELTVKSAAGEAKTGVQQRYAFGVFGGNDSYDYWSGEVRYLYRDSDLKLASGGTKVGFGGHTHIVNADFLAHFAPRAAKVRPFVAFGGGVKVLVGTGLESSTQPLGNFAALTHTREVLPVADVGAGVKVKMAKYLQLRFEFRDYISTTPSKVIAAAPGASLDGVWNDFIGTVGVSVTW